MQIVGFATTFALIFTLGAFYVMFILAILLLSVIWYRVYVRERVARRGAIYGLYRRLGEIHDEGVDQELWSILQERGASEADSFDELIARARIIEFDDRTDLDAVTDAVAQALNDMIQIDPAYVRACLDDATERGIVPRGAPAAVFDLPLPSIDHSEAVLVRAKRGVPIASAGSFPGSGSTGEARDQSGTVPALLFLAAPEAQVTQRLRLLAPLVSMVEIPGFARAWRRAGTDQELLETLLRSERFASLVVGAPGPPSRMVDKRLRELDFPGDTLVAMVRRDNQTIVPHGDTMLREGDRLTVLGSPEHVAELLTGD